MAEEQATPTPKLHIDSDWKAEAQKEKERLASKEQANASKTAKPAAAGSGAGRGAQPAAPRSGAAASSDGLADADAAGPGAPHELPEASFRSLVGMLASQAIMGLGAVADQQTNRVVIDLEGSRFAIDLLDVLDQKTKGNLTTEETKELAQILAELRNRYVQISNFVVRQMAAQQAGQTNVAGATAAAVTGQQPGQPVPPLRQ